MDKNIYWYELYFFGDEDSQENNGRENLLKIALVLWKYQKMMLNSLMWKDLQRELKVNTEYIIQGNEKHIM